jgi:hypothetical protein
VTRGPNFSGGYQFGVDGRSTDAATLRRERPLQHTKLSNGAEIQIVPLTGGRQLVFDVCASWQELHPERGLTQVSSTYIAQDELDAKAEFHRLVRRLSP